jgi:hypothetical protein
MKLAHERRAGRRRTRVPTAVLRKIQADVATYWEQVHVANTKRHAAPPDVRLDVDTGASFTVLVRRARRTAAQIDDVIAEIYPERAEPGTHWEWLNLALPNLFQRLDMLFEQITVRYLEQELAAHPNDAGVGHRLERARARFLRRARREVISD